MGQGGLLLPEETGEPTGKRFLASGQFRLGGAGAGHANLKGVFPTELCLLLGAGTTHRSELFGETTIHGLPFLIYFVLLVTRRVPFNVSNGGAPKHKVHEVLIDTPCRRSKRVVRIERLLLLVLFGHLSGHGFLPDRKST